MYSWEWTRCSKYIAYFIICYFILWNHSQPYNYTVPNERFGTLFAKRRSPDLSNSFIFRILTYWKMLGFFKTRENFKDPPEEPNRLAFIFYVTQINSKCDYQKLWLSMKTLFILFLGVCTTVIVTTPFHNISINCVDKWRAHDRFREFEVEEIIHFNEFL